MASQSDIVEFQQSLDNLSTVAIAELVVYWDSLDFGDPAKATAQTRDAFAALNDKYWPMSAELGALWFEQLRSDADPGATHTTRLPDDPGVAAVQDTLGWCAIPLFDDTQDVDGALDRFGMTLQRQVTMPARSTVELNVRTDPAHPRWARHASGNACAFCAMLASRGAVYWTEESAGLARKYHPHCHCVPVAVWPGQEYHPAPYVAEWERAYKEASRSKAGTKAILAEMRRTLGAA